MTLHTPSTLPRDPATIRRFILAGRAEFTLVNRATGGGFTFAVNKCDRPGSDSKPMWFVNLLPARQYLGLLREDDFVPSRKHRANESPATYALQWFWLRLCNNVLHDNVDVIHIGKCGVCGRALTRPESILRGIGPECWEKL